jgi:hypothetical protein
MFHCLVWIVYSFLTDVQLKTVDVPLCGVESVFLLDRCSIVWCGMGIHSWQMSNLELLMFHCVVWIGYSVLTAVQLRTVDVPLCGVDWVFLLDRCSTYNCWCSIMWCGSCIPSWQMFNLELLMFHCVVWIVYSFLTYFNLELLMFHCVVWIGYSFLTDVQLRIVDIPLCDVDRVLLLHSCST